MSLTHTCGWTAHTWNDGAAHSDVCGQPATKQVQTATNYGVVGGDSWKEWKTWWVCDDHYKIYIELEEQQHEDVRL